MLTQNRIFISLEHIRCTTTHDQKDIMQLIFTGIPLWETDWSIGSIDSFWIKYVCFIFSPTSLSGQDFWKDEFSHLPITLPKVPNNNSRHGRHLFTILINENAKVKRDEFLQRMQKENIGVGVHYLSIPEHPFYKNTFGWNAQDYPIAMKIGRTTVSLPI